MVSVSVSVSSATTHFVPLYFRILSLTSPARSISACSIYSAFVVVVSATALIGVHLLPSQPSTCPLSGAASSTVRPWSFSTLKLANVPLTSPPAAVFVVTPALPMLISPPLIAMLLPAVYVVFVSVSAAGAHSDSEASHFKTWPLLGALSVTLRCCNNIAFSVVVSVSVSAAGAHESPSHFNTWFASGPVSSTLRPWSLATVRLANVPLTSPPAAVFAVTPVLPMLISLPFTAMLSPAV